MPATLRNILGQKGAVARRLGQRYEFRPQQLEMASAVEDALTQGHHLLVEAGTGVGKSFAYLLPAIDFAVRTKKRVVISTHTISLQEQLIEKDIPLLRAVYPDEFTAVLVKGRSNYLCRRRLGQARSRQQMLFDDGRQLESLWAIEEWANETTDGSLADLPALPNAGVWDRVCAERGNCLGKKCEFYNNCFWQAAKRRMQGGTILVLNHALFFSDLALRMVGVNYLPKYDAVILDEAHTLEDVAGSHFGLKVTESGVRYQLRQLYDTRRGKGVLSTLDSEANQAINDIVNLHEPLDEFFEGLVQWQQNSGRGNGRINQPNIVENILSPRLRDLSLHLRAMLPSLAKEEQITEVTSIADKVDVLSKTIEAVLGQTLEDGVYWMEVAGKYDERKVSLNAAPVCVADGLRTHLFGQVRSVVMTSATLCTAGGGKTSRGTDDPPVQADDPKSVNQRDAQSPTLEPTPQQTQHGRDARATEEERPLSRGTGVSPVQGLGSGGISIRKGAYLPHWTKENGICSVTFRLADSLPQHVLQGWKTERETLARIARVRTLTPDEAQRLGELASDAVERFLDAGYGECLLNDNAVAEIVATALRFFDKQKYTLLAWCIMPNHVHVVVQPFASQDLPGILHSWKSHTSHKVNKLLGREGEFWQSEYYDHLIRDEDELIHAVKYAWSNPEQAGFPEWKWRDKDESQVMAVVHGTLPVPGQHGRDARATGEQQPPSRGTGVSPVLAKSSPNAPNTRADKSSPRKQHGRDARATAGDPFKYIKSRIGVAECKTLQLGSPFDYANQATLYIETDLPEPTDAQRFLPAACEKILQYLDLTNGGAFVLFTSYKMLTDAGNRLKPELDRMNLPLLLQGQQAPRKVLLERFRTTPNAVLFGTSSFWQGIDVQGDALRNVIIVKLPFAVPDEPVIEARLEVIKRTGGNAFMDYSVPEAIIKLKQGFGRLIRSKTDKGIVVILDSRVKTKRYGRLFLDALPECRIVER